MARIEHHAAFAFLSYYLIYYFWQNSIVPGWIVLLTIIFGVLPDLDIIYWKLKGGKIDTQFQHHLYYWTHWPISYFPILIIFLISLIFDFYPEYFLIPVISLYIGHFIPDSISTGDGIMWLKLPWKKKRFARYINLFSSKTDGYHGTFWEARVKKTLFLKFANIAVISAIIIIFILLIESSFLNFFYLISLCFLLFSFLYSFRKIPKHFLKEPPEGRYSDYRVNMDYINGLSEKNKKKHYIKYSNLLAQE